MDLCSAGSVKDLMKTCVETLDEAQIAMISREVLKGLAYLHQRGIVHMDVKAANILLTEDASVKLGGSCSLPLSFSLCSLIDDTF